MNIPIPNSKRFELHSHTHYSKGKKIPCEALASPAEIIREAKRRGLAGIAITDHDTNRAWAQARAEAREQGILFIPGIEISTQRGHVLGLGLSEFIRPGLMVEETVDKIHEQGGLAIAAHPFDIRNDGLKHDMIKTDVIEVFNAMAIDRISNIFTERRARKLNMPAIAATDAHTKEMVGTATTSISAEACNSIDSVLREIKAGRVELGRGYVPMNLLVDWAKTRMTVSYEDIIHYIKNNYSAPRAWFSEALLHKFLFSKRRLPYDILARFGASCSVIYSGIKLISYL